MRHVLTAAAAAALIAAMASPAVASPDTQTGTPSSNAAGAATSALNVNERNGSFDLQSHRGGRGEWTEESLTAFRQLPEAGRDHPGAGHPPDRRRQGHRLARRHHPGEQVGRHRTGHRRRPRVPVRGRPRGRAVPGPGQDPKLRLHAAARLPGPGRHRGQPDRRAQGRVPAGPRHQRRESPLQRGNQGERQRDRRRRHGVPHPG